jgi:purine-nucleoside phosphorylase
VTYYDQVLQAADAIRRRVSALPAIGVVLGSGLGGFADSLGAPIAIPYDQLPHWPASTVAGHHGRLVVGTVRGKGVAALSGRCHLYEGYDAQAVTFGVRVLGVLGVRTLILTSAAGGVDPGLSPGTLMVIDDHINLTGRNPLIGPNEARFGTRFPDMTEVYSSGLRNTADRAGQGLGLSLSHGVYAALLGPSYETPAEIRYLQVIGAHAVGMSTALEALAARHMGIAVLGVSCITNTAAGVAAGPVDHAAVIETAHRVRGALHSLLEGIIDQL